jgi:hypothetical protein
LNFLSFYQNIPKIYWKYSKYFINEKLIQNNLNLIEDFFELKIILINYHDNIENIGFLKLKQLLNIIDYMSLNNLKFKNYNQNDDKLNDIFEIFEVNNILITIDNKKFV